MAMREFTSHLSIWSLAISGSCLCEGLFGEYVMAYVNSMSSSVMDGEGVMGRKLWLGTPITHRMSGLNLVGHWHGR
jgi:hypothetical protein